MLAAFGGRRSSSATSSPSSASRARARNGMPELHKLTPPLGALQKKGFASPSSPTAA